MGEFLNPFSEVAISYLKKVDMAIIAENINDLKHLLEEFEKIIVNEDSASQAQLYYVAGNIYDEWKL